MLNGMNQIWRQADIELRLETVFTVEVPTNVLKGILAEELRPFFYNLSRNINVPEAAAINGYYVRGLGGPNGISVPSIRDYFVMDTQAFSTAGSAAMRWVTFWGWGTP